jgi:hypothetical protein
MEHGELSKPVREALKLYLNSERSRELLERLDELQKKNPVQTSTAKEIRLINADRKR